MNGNTGNRNSTQHKGGNQFITGILIGMVIGVSLAAAMAWFMKNSPSPFVKLEPKAILIPSDSQANTQPRPAASGVDGKPRFSFYEVLTNKKDTPLAAPEKPAEKPKVSAIYEPQILQAGSFSNEVEAEKLKARLALLGYEAGVQPATIPDKGVWYRVRIGPYKTADEMNSARNFLKQNGVESTPMRAQ